MKIIKFKWRFFFIFLLMGLGGSELLALGNTESEQKRNVLFIMCDDLNDYQGIFGGHPQTQTPNIDKFAGSAARFVNAQSNIPVCMPSRSSLFTGVYSHDSKDFGWTKRPEQAVLKHNKTLMSLFQENGYSTFGSGKLLHHFEKDHWDEWGMPVKHNYGPFVTDGESLIAHPNVPAPYNTIGPVDGSYGRLSQASNWAYGRDMKPFHYKSDQNRDLMQDELHAKWAVEKLQQMENENMNQPFFMGIGFVKPHTPLNAPDRFFDMFPLDDLELDDWMESDIADTYFEENIGNDSKGYRYFRMLVESYGGDRELAIKHFLQAYLACVAFVDEQVGKVIEALNNSSFAENTVVVFTSDHGWQMGEKEYLFKNSPWEESARIPFIVRTPEMEKGKIIDQPVGLIDLFPTLVDYCGLEGNHKLSPEGGEIGGNSVMPLIDNDPKTHWDGPGGALSIVGNFGKEHSVEEQNYSYRTKDFRYIHYANGKEELYNHINDPYEWNNLASDPKYIEVKTDMKRQMSDIIGVEFKIISL